MKFSIWSILIITIWTYAESLKTDCPYISNQNRPLVIAHRGSCGMFPEHSAAAYTTAYYDGTDFNEPDLQVTKDGKLLIMHNPWMKETTNIDSISKFSNRKVNITFVGKQQILNWTNDYLVNDFTWNELVDAGVKLRNRFSTRNSYFNDMFPIMNFEEAIELMLNLNEKASHKDKFFKTGLYVETKQVQFYLEQRNVDIAKLVYEVLRKYEIDTVEKATNKLPIILESFEEGSLLYFKSVTDLPRIQLVHPYLKYDFKWISQYAHGVGPYHEYLFKYKDENFNLDKPSLFIQECHSLGLLVHPWIMQDDILQYTNSSIDETKVYLVKGVDGIFTEFPQSTYQSIIHLTNCYADQYDSIKFKLIDL